MDSDALSLPMYNLHEQVNKVVTLNSSSEEWDKDLTERNMLQLAIISQMVRTLRIIVLDIMMVVSEVLASLIHWVSTPL
jgi:hypothetical protein